MKKRISLMRGLVLISCVSLNAHAQDEGSFFIGGFELTPTLNLQRIDDSNVYQDDNEESSTLTLINPSVRAVFDTGTSGFTMGYSLFDASYSSLDDENYTDHLFDLSFGSIISDTQRFQIDSSLFKSHDARGPDAPSGRLSRDLDKYEESSTDASYNIGGDDSRIQLSLLGGTLSREYTSNRDTTRELDRKETSYGAEIGFYLANDVVGRLTTGVLKVDYDQDDSNRDSEEQSNGVGLTWTPSSQTRVVADWSVLDRSFDTGDRDDISTSNWGLTFDWSPLSYSQFSFSSDTSIEETPNGIGDAILVTRHSASWSHDWNERFSTLLGYEYSESDYEGVRRKDEAHDYNLSLDYSSRRWLTMGLTGQYTSQDSNAIDDYDRTQLGFNLLITL